MQSVKLTYFKQTGKYYSEGCYWCKRTFGFEVLEEIRGMQQRRELPGISDGSGFIILVEIEETEALIGPFATLIIPEVIPDF